MNKNANKNSEQNFTQEVLTTEGVNILFTNATVRRLGNERNARYCEIPLTLQKGRDMLGKQGGDSMVDLSGFTAFDFSEGVPYCSITANGVTFNKAVTLKMGSPAYVRLLINGDSRQIILQACDEDTPRAVAFYRPKKNGVMSVRWNSMDLLSTFKRLLDSDLQHGYRVDGELVGDGMMLFDLNAAKTLV